MSPVVHAVAMVTSAGSDFGANGAGLIPFAVTPAQATNAYYHIYTFDKHSIGSGNFGKLDLSSVDPGFDWASAMVSGCNCTLNVNNFYPDDSGNAHIDDGFLARLNSNPYVVMPVFDNPDPGNGAGGDVIIGFVTVKLLAVATGGSWVVTAENVPSAFGGGFGEAAAAVRMQRFPWPACWFNNSYQL